MAAGDDRISFVGYVTGSTVGELYSNACVFALPSDLEGMSNSLLEAMSYGDCCFLSDIPENVEPAGECAAYFHAGDVEDCRKRLQELLDNPGRISSLGTSAKEHVLSSYSWDGAVDLTLDVYRRVVECGRL